MGLIDEVKQTVALASSDSSDVVIYMKVTCPIDGLSDLKDEIERCATLDEAVLVFPQNPVKWE